jgi:hypothetical protein
MLTLPLSRLSTVKGGRIKGIEEALSAVSLPSIPERTILELS